MLLFSIIFCIANCSFRCCFLYSYIIYSDYRSTWKKERITLAHLVHVCKAWPYIWASVKSSEEVLWQDSPCSQPYPTKDLCGVTVAAWFFISGCAWQTAAACGTQTLFGKFWCIALPYYAWCTYAVRYIIGYTYSDIRRLTLTAYCDSLSGVHAMCILQTKKR